MFIAGQDLAKIKSSSVGEKIENLQTIRESIYDALCDDLNTPIAIAQLFEVVRVVNTIKEKGAIIHSDDMALLSELFNDVTNDILGLKDEKVLSSNGEVLTGVMELILEMRREAKQKKDFGTSDMIRQKLTDLGVQIKDTKEGTEWNLN